MSDARSQLHTVAAADTQSVDQALRGRLFRRIGVVAMAVLVVAGVFGWVGHRQGHATAESAGFRLAVSYPQISRGGLAANTEIRVATTDGAPLPSAFQLRSASGYFEIFDENGFEPDPVGASTNGTTVTWEFEPDDGATEFVIDLDARLQPNSRGWFDASTALVVDGRIVVEVDYRTWVVP